MTCFVQSYANCPVRCSLPSPRRTGMRREVDPQNRGGDKVSLEASLLLLHCVRRRKIPAAPRSRPCCYRIAAAVESSPLMPKSEWEGRRWLFKEGEAHAGGCDLH
nr:hypothetical protein Itr_chr06CG17880 [Ipomoea trifida]